MANTKLAHECEVGQEFPFRIESRLGGVKSVMFETKKLAKIIVPTWRTHFLHWWDGQIGFQYNCGLVMWWYPNDRITVV